jgi:hypothetical protein
MESGGQGEGEVRSGKGSDEPERLMLGIPRTIEKTCQFGHFAQPLNGTPDSLVNPSSRINEIASID